MEQSRISGDYGEWPDSALTDDRAGTIKTGQNG